MQYRQLFFSLCTLLAFFPVTSFALPVDCDDSGSVWYTDGISKVGTDGASMEGMTVTVTFSNKKTETITWVKTKDPINRPASEGLDTPGSGEAKGTGWSLAVNEGSTYLFFKEKFVPWTFTVNKNVSVSQLFIDAGTGNTVFDIVPREDSVKDSTSTSGSQSGTPFAYYGSSADDSDLVGNTTATYSGLVALTGQEPLFDLYRYLSIDFVYDDNDKPLTDGVVHFSADTDTVKSALVVPEPTTLALFGIGLAGLAGVASRKRRT